MTLDETWQVGLKPEKTKACKFPAKSRDEFRRDRENRSQRRCFCDVNGEPHNTSATFLGSISAKLYTKRVHVLARDTWFHIPEMFPLRGRISRKTAFLWFKKLPCLCSGYGSRETSATPTLSLSRRGASHRCAFPS